jgi:hypothetical protein
MNFTSHVDATAAVILAGSAFLSYIVARQARQRGYNMGVWLLTGMVGSALYLLVVLAVLPNRAKQRLRGQYLRELDEKLAARSSLSPTAADRQVDERSLGDRPTIDATAQRSLGDAPTFMPRDQSVGDEATRME